MKTPATYDDVLKQIKHFNDLYEEVYALYSALSKENFSLRSAFIHTLHQKLNGLKELFREIETNVETLDPGLQLSLEDRLKDVRSSMTIVTHCLSNPHLKDNWIRVRVWYSGYYRTDNTFVPGSIITTAVSEIINRTKTNVGHVTLELPTGYFSFWPDLDDTGLPHVFLTLAKDKYREGPPNGSDRDPDRTFTLFTLNVTAMDEFCRNYVRQDVLYKFVSKKKDSKLSSSSQPADNCVSSVLKVLKAGDIDLLATNRNFARNITGIVPPQDFAECLEEAEKNERTRYPLTQDLQAPTIEVPKVFGAGATPLLVQGDFDAPDISYLSLRKGDVIILEKMSDKSGYLLCRDKNNKHGLVHSGLVSFKTSFDTRNSGAPVSLSQALDGLTYNQIDDPAPCLFRAIASSMGPTFNAVFIRNSLSHYLETNFDECRKYRPGKKEDFLKYIQDIKDGNEWNDIVEIEILQKMMNRPIIIIKPDATPLIPTNVNEYKNPPVFIYQNHGHYDYFALEPGKDAKAILQQIQAAVRAGDDEAKALAHAAMPVPLPETRPEETPARCVIS